MFKHEFKMMSHLMNITECTAFKASVTDAASKVYFSLAVIINILIKRLIY